jgi:hypothetical protein
MEYPCWLNSGLLLVSPSPDPEGKEINTFMLSLNDKKKTSFPSCPLATSTILVMEQSVI